MNNHTYTIYNSLVKRAGFISPSIGNPGTAVNIPGNYAVGTQGWRNEMLQRLKDSGAIMDKTPKPSLPLPSDYIWAGKGLYDNTSTAIGELTQPAPVVNPTTGGTRIMYKGGPVGPNTLDDEPLPITPYSSGKINIQSLQQARRQAAKIDSARRLNDLKKQMNAQNLDAMFKSLHETNQQRKAVGLPEYVPQAMDFYAPYAYSGEDYADAENRLYNDMNLSTIAQEAAKRGTPLNEAEINELSAWMPNEYEPRMSQRDSSQPYIQFAGLKLPNIPSATPDNIGARANGVYNDEHQNENIKK